MEPTPIVLRAGRAQVVVDPARGGAIESVRVDGRELLGGAELSGDEPSRFLRGCFVMAPFTGLLTGEVGGRRIAANTPHGAEHGTVYDSEWQVVAGGAGDNLHLRSGLGPRWPFRGSAELSVDVSDESLRLRLAVHAEQTMPVSLGFHPWFPRSLGSADAEIIIDAAGSHVFDDTGMALADIGPMTPRPWDHVLTGVRSAPVIRWPELTLTLTASTQTWVVYEQLPTAFCVEPVTAPAGAVAAGQTLLEAGCTRELEFELAW
jgi:aldose 1-epimerase